MSEARARLHATLLTLLAAVTFNATAIAAEARFHFFAYEGRNSEGATTQSAPGEFLNPVIAGLAADPSITRVGDDYYLVNSSFAHFPGLPIHHSKDLVSWRQIGNAIDRPEQLSFDGMAVPEGIMAPDISHKNGTFYIVSTNSKNFVITAKNPAGPWSQPTWFDFDGIDPSIFWEDDGKAYIVNNGAPQGRPLYEGHRVIWIQEFDPIHLKMVGSRTALIGAGAHPPHIFWAEGPHIFKREGFYYLLAAAGGTRPDERHSEIVFRSRNLMGPYEIYPDNPILDQNDLPADRSHPVESAGHAKFVTTQRGDWWAVFLGARPYAPQLYSIGRETFLLPVSWKDGWPVILEKGKPVPWKVPKPNLPAMPEPSTPVNGDFSYVEDFDAKTLSSGWTGIRIPEEPVYRLDKGDLVLVAREQAIGDRNHVPAFVGRRQAHPLATITTSLSYSPDDDGDRAGLLTVQTDDHYLFVGVQQIDGSKHVVVSARKGAGDPKQGVRITSAPLPRDLKRPVYLRLSINGGHASAEYALRKDEWQSLIRDLDVTFLSTKYSSGFVGAVIGPYDER